MGMILTSRVDDAQMVEDDSPDGSNIAAAIQACLGVATMGMGVTLDHAAAGRLLGDSFREFSPQDSVEVVHGRLIELGPSLGMRVDTVQANLEQGIALVRPGAPVLHLRIVGKELHWLLLTDHRGRRIKVQSSNPAY